uniref:DPPIV_N domain-containing protein n=1 Tax=Macrostomum lignano TaxID=282301 RepID=A0A1I8FKN5_9PLAT
MDTRKHTQLPDELVGSAPSQKNWKGVVIALLVIVSILLLIACAIFALAENVLLYLNSSNGNLMRAKFYNSNNTAATGQHSSKAVYKVVLLKSDSRDFITEKILCPTTNCDASNQQKLQIIRWGTAGRFLAFVYKGNVYYTDNPLEMRPVRITDNLGDPAVSFGAADWLYEEEVLQSDNALWIAPGNLYLAYLQFNDTSVPAYSMPWYGDPGQMYLQSRLIRYRQLEMRPVYRTSHCGSTTSKALREWALKPPTGVPTESYVTKLAWLNESHLVAAWLDRSQTIGYLGVCTALSGGDCRLIYSGNQLDQQDGWMEFGNLLPDTRNGRVLTVLHNSGYRRIASIRLSGQNQVSWISPAKYDVAELLRLELPSQPSQPGSSGRLYFLSCRDDNSDSYDATKMHVHSISATENAPSSQLHHLSKELKNTALALIVEDNLEFSRNLIGRNLPRVEFRQLRLRLKTTLESRADPLSVNAKLLLPKQLNESHISQYPLLMH